VAHKLVVIVAIAFALQRARSPTATIDTPVTSAIASTPRTLLQGGRPFGPVGRVQSEVNAMTRRAIEIALAVCLMAGCASTPNAAVSVAQECTRDGGWWRAELGLCEVQGPGGHR